MKERLQRNYNYLVIIKMKEQVHITTHFFGLVDSEWMQRLQDDETLESENSPAESHNRNRKLSKDCITFSISKCEANL